MFKALTFSYFKKYAAVIDTSFVERRGKCRLSIIGVAISKKKIQDIAPEEYANANSTIISIACLFITYLNKAKDQMVYFA